MDRIDPIRGPAGPFPAPDAIPAIRRTKRSQDERERPDERDRQRRRQAPRQPPPPDDGRPHIDVRV